MKGISQLMVVILLLLISFSMVSLYFLWSKNVLFEIFPSESTETQYLRSRSCLGIENIYKAVDGSLKIKNCGKTPLKEIILYVDYTEYEISQTQLNPQEHMIVEIDTSEVHEYIAISDLAESATIRE